MLDKKLKILNSLERDEYISLQELHAKCGIKNIFSFGVHLDMLGRQGYVQANEDNKVSLGYYSSVRAYLYDRNKRILSSVAVVVGVISAVIAAAIAIVSLF